MPLRHSLHESYRVSPGFIAFLVLLEVVSPIFSGPIPSQSRIKKIDNGKEFYAQIT